MNGARRLYLAVTTLVTGCASQASALRHVDDAEQAVEKARQHGAATSSVSSSEHLRWAEEQLAVGRALAETGPADRAERVLQRAQVDAELAAQLADEAKAKARAAAARGQLGATTSPMEQRP